MDVEKKIKEILTTAVKFRASDIHFVPMERNAVIRFRIDGNLVEMEKLPISFIVKLINHLKFISKMDVGERRRPQNTSIDISLVNKTYSIRLSTFPSTAYETLVIRLFPYENHQSLHQLSLFPKQAIKLLNMIRASNGLIIICGPTGTGKTTTLYSLLHSSFYAWRRNIITLEDPVEQKHGDFLQMEINERAGVTYASGLRSLLRHDPDIIMIGEIRDAETAKMAIRSALTGHLVFSTLHSKNSISALRRLHELGISVMDLKDTVTGIVAQQLVNIVCPYCGSSCSKFCKRERTRRRGAIYEILTDNNLRDAIACLDHDGNHEGGKLKITTLDNLVCKGIALGFIPEDEHSIPEWGGKIK
ncbi:competence type IV pilus ATPase ComGA [Evansella sp. AB-rgal1]|uniref:competence type IV pilus ATPase ComGA n=1 Tax=Evansella sp. AB-rgal1 TaxID=3242696 RepID=UPI00359E48FC